MSAIGEMPFGELEPSCFSECTDCIGAPLRGSLSVELEMLQTRAGVTLSANSLSMAATNCRTAGPIGGW